VNTDPFEQPDDELPPADEPVGEHPGDDEFGSRVRFSRLKLLAKSPAHYLAHPEGESTAKEKGTAVHEVLLKGRAVVVWSKKNKAGKTAPRTGDDFRDFASAHAGKLILLPSTYDPAMRAIEAVRANRRAMEALAGVREETLLFDMMGLECRSTPDTRAPTHFAELKTCRTSDPWRFRWQAKSLAYHAQMAFHAEAIRRNKLGDGATGYIVAVESAPPYPVTVFELTVKDFEKGEKKIRFWMERLKACISAQQWPPYAQDVVPLDIQEDEIDLPGAVAGDDPSLPWNGAGDAADGADIPF
jgi:hypothetical protein